MKAKPRKKSKPADTQDLAGKIDTLAQRLEDLFILQALLSGVRRDHIRKMLGVHTTRISKINIGVKNRILKNDAKA